MIPSLNFECPKIVPIVHFYYQTGTISRLSILIRCLLTFLFTRMVLRYLRNPILVGLVDWDSSHVNSKFISHLLCPFVPNQIRDSQELNGLRFPIHHSSEVRFYRISKFFESRIWSGIGISLVIRLIRGSSSESTFWHLVRFCFVVFDRVYNVAHPRRIWVLFSAGHLTSTERMRQESTWEYSRLALIIHWIDILLQQARTISVKKIWFRKDQRF
jgi:hypothetical protein